MNINTVTLTGNLTKDVDLTYISNGTPKAVFVLAVDRPQREGQQQNADFPRIVVWGKQAENCANYLKKGSPIALKGRLTTGKYEANGQIIYTTDVTAEQVQFLARKERDEAFDSFSEINIDMPF